VQRTGRGRAIIGIVDEVKLDALHEAELAAARKGRN